MTQPVVGHLDPVFFQVMDEVCEMLRQVFHTGNRVTMPNLRHRKREQWKPLASTCWSGVTPLSSVATGISEFVSPTSPNVAGRTRSMVDSPWGKPADLNALEDALNANPGAKMVGLVHAETSTGAITPLQDAIDLAHRHGALVVADAVTSLGSHDVQVDDWDIDRLLQRQPEVPRRASGPRSHQLRRPATGHERNRPARHFRGELLLQSARRRRVLERDPARLSPHQPHHHDLRHARITADDDGGGASRDATTATPRLPPASAPA